MTQPAGTELPDWLRPLADLVAEPAPDVLTGWTVPAGVTPRHASVLVLVGEGSEGPDVLLLERAHDMRSHAGQVAFPGGSQDASDADEVAAALREAEEETGLDPAGVHVLGTLPRIWLQPSNFDVTPVVGWWRARSAVHAVDPAETASVHTVPVARLAEPANRLTIRYPSGFSGPAFLIDDLVIWGFTAGLLSRILALVGWELPWDAAHVVDLPAAMTAGSFRDVERSEFER